MSEGSVYVQTNDAGANAVIAFRRAEDGTLSRLGAYETGGRGSGKAHLASQGSVVLADEGRVLVVANAGSDDVSVFSVGDDGLSLVDRVRSAGTAPTSIAVHGRLVYVLSSAEPANVSGFTLDQGKLKPIEGSTRLVGQGADPAQAAFSPDGTVLVVTDRGTDSIATFAVGRDGVAREPTLQPSSGATPYGFDFTSGGVLVVTEAFGGAIGEAAASSYSISAHDRLTLRSGTVGDTRSEVCWAVVTNDDRFAYVTNFGDGTISSYAIESDGSIRLLEPVAATTNLGVKGVRDEALTGDGRFLYALDADAQRIFGFRVAQDGRLSPVGEAEGMPATVAGLAAS